jgi:hypothetical protein
MQSGPHGLLTAAAHLPVPLASAAQHRSERLYDGRTRAFLAEHRRRAAALKHPRRHRAAPHRSVLRSQGCAAWDAYVPA